MSDTTKKYPGDHFTTYQKVWLARDPVAKTLPNGTQLIELSFFQNSGNAQPGNQDVLVRASFNATSKHAKLAGKLRKQDAVGLRGTVTIRAWVDKEGGTRLGGDIAYADGLVYCGGEKIFDRPSIGEGAAPAPATPAPARRAPVAAPADDEYPF